MGQVNSKTWPGDVRRATEEAMTHPYPHPARRGVGGVLVRTWPPDWTGPRRRKRAGRNYDLVMVPSEPRAGDEYPDRSQASVMDVESAKWLRALQGTQREKALEDLHELLLKIARREVHRRNTAGQITGPELDDVAHQAAADALILVTKKLEQFRGDSRFTTWAYKFVMFEVSTKLSRHFWRSSRSTDHDTEWDRVPDRFGIAPAEQAEAQELLTALRRAVETCLTDRQRQVFVAIIVEGVPLDALVAEMGTNRNAVYKIMFDTRRKLRNELITLGHLDPDSGGQP
jgi:RNA polymerase sigma-70 factor (ECF subfamily)